MNSSLSGSHSLKLPDWYLISTLPWPLFYTSVFHDPGSCFCRSSLWLMMLNLEHQLMYPRITPPLMFPVEVLCLLCFWAAALPRYLHEARLVPLVSRGKGLALLLSSLLCDHSRSPSMNSFLRFVLIFCWSPHMDMYCSGLVILVWYVCSLDWSLKQIASLVDARYSLNRGY